ncbi:MAG: aminotransferase class V-fold PLP-dependent enzyme [Myxococcaceae bacterium]
MPAQIYLDNASTSFPKPESVYQAVEKFMRQGGASPGRGSYPKAQESERIVIKLRSKLSKLLGISDPTNLIFTNNATDALNLALKGFLKQGDHVVTTDIEHNAVLRPLASLQKSHHIDFTTVKSNLIGEISPDDILKAIRPQTRLVTCVHASNVLGTLQPIQEISKITRERNIILLVDGSQTTGAIPIDIKELGVDIFVFTGHKSLLGLTGTGGLFIRSDLDLKPLREGGNGSHSNSLEQPLERPERYESGTPNMIGLAGLLGGVEYLLETGVDKIRAHELELTNLFVEQLNNIENIKVYGPEAAKKVAITSINLASLDPSEVGQMLGKKFGICVRTGLHCAPFTKQSTVRFSFGWSNTRRDIEAACEALREISAAIYRRV